MRNANHLLFTKHRFTVLCIVGLMSVLITTLVSADEPAIDMEFDFESFTLGALNGQDEWRTNHDNITVTASAARNGNQSVQVSGDGASGMSLYYNFTLIEKGRIDWWAKTDSKTRMVTQFQQTSADGTKRAEWFGFNTDGTFVYYDGDVRSFSEATYQLDTWYRFSVLFDSAEQTKTLIVSDMNGPVFIQEDVAYWDSGITGMNRITFSTLSSATGSFHIDDIRITNITGEDMEQLTDLTVSPDRIVLTEGQRIKMQVIGHFPDHSYSLLKEEDGIRVSSDRPEVAIAEGGETIRAVGKGEANISVRYSTYSSDAVVTVYGEGETPPYKNIDPRPLNRTTHLHELKIFTPESEEWMQAGEQIAQTLKQKWNINAEVEASHNDLIGEGWVENIILLGNLGNNPHIARLYGLYLTYSDAVHPGSGGYQLQTIADPFGLGGNTIVLGSSDVAGLNKGTERMVDLINALNEPILPWLSETVLSSEASSALPYGSNPSDTQVQTMIDALDSLIDQLNPTSSEELEANHLLSLLERVMYYGKLFQITTNENYGRVYKHALDAYTAFLHQYPDTAKAQLSSNRNMWTSGYAAIGSYTVMEASPLFHESERKEYVSAWYLTYETNAKDRYLNNAAPTGARNNHDAYPALSLIFGASYFQNYYSFPESDAWYALGEQIFTGNTSNINLDEGSDYLMHVPAITLEYAMATGDQKFLAQGLRPSADLNAMMIDNLGTMSGGGDVYPFGRSSAYTWNHSQVMNAATWFFGDPVYQFLLERTRTGPFDGQNMSDLEFPFHRYVTDHLPQSGIPEDRPKVQAYPVERGVYDLLLEEEGPLTVPIEDAFHKLAFRKGFALDDDYLMLDGFSAGRHGHLDGNTILKYSANGRIFIDDRDYIEKAPKHHTGLVVVKNGEQEHKPPLTKLEWAADAGGIGISRSEVPDYNGTDWTRTIISPGGEFFLIYDDVKMLEDGDYLLENTWQTLGDVSRLHDRFEVEQQGVTMTLQSLDDSDLREYERYGHFIKYWKTIYPYPYADEEHVLREVKEEESYSAGETSHFVNVLSSAADGETKVQAWRIHDDVVRIEKGNDEWYAAWDSLATDQLESDAKFTLIGEEEVLFAEITYVRIGDEMLQFDEPVLFKIRASDGYWETYRLTHGMTRYDENGEPIQVGAISEGNVSFDSSWMNGLFNRARTPWKKTGEKIDYNRDWQRHALIGEEVTSSASADLDGDGYDELLLGTVTGKITALDHEGNLLWTFQANGRINEVTVEQINGNPTVLAATENWYVHVLNHAGEQNWNVEIPNSSARREMKGNLLGVTNVRVAYVNGPEEDPWIMVGTQFRYLYGYDLQGNMQYEDIVYFYGIEDMEFMDLDSDGKDEGVIGTEYYYYSILDEGNLGRYGGSNGPGPGYKIIETVQANGQAAFVYGTKLNKVHLVQYNGSAPEEIWSRNVGGEVNDIRIGDFDSDGEFEVVVASDGHYLYLLNSDGSLRWKKELGDRVMQVNMRSTAEGTAYFAATDHGGLVVVNSEGEQRDRYRFPELIEAIHTQQGSEKVWIVLKDGSIYQNKRS